MSELVVCNPVSFSPSKDISYLIVTDLTIGLGIDFQLLITAVEDAVKNQKELYILLRNQRTAIGKFNTDGILKCAKYISEICSIEAKSQQTTYSCDNITLLIEPLIDDSNTQLGVNLTREYIQNIKKYGFKVSCRPLPGYSDDKFFNTYGSLFDSVTITHLTSTNVSSDILGRLSFNLILTPKQQTSLKPARLFRLYNDKRHNEPITTQFVLATHQDAISNIFLV